MDGEIHGGDVSALQRADELCLFFGIEAEVGIDAEDQVVMPRIAGAGEGMETTRRIAAFVAGARARPVRAAATSSSWSPTARSLAR